MRSLAEYIVTVSAAALVCSILGCMMPKGTAKEIIKLVSGLFLAFTVIRPIADLQIPDVTQVGEQFRHEAAQAAQAGEDLTRETLSERIKQELEAYILDKAAELRLELTVEVILSEADYHPERIRLYGDASPRAKQEMLLFLTRDLGVLEENIQW